MLTNEKKLAKKKAEALKMEQKALKQLDFSAALLFARMLLRLDIQEAVITGKSSQEEYATLVH